jgi:phosphoglycerate dehydrogenase-like enzyme
MAEKGDEMTSIESAVKVAILDDYQNVALQMADWSPLAGRATISVFNDHLDEPDALAARLAPFEVVCVMRERTPLTRGLLERLPRLKLIASTAFRNASIDLQAARERGIAVANTGYDSTPTIEMTWALILASARHVAAENASLRSGGWQRRIGNDLKGKTLGVLGLGNIGGEVARIGHAFGMRVIAWSENLTAEKATAAGAELVRKEELFRQSDVLTIHLVLGRRSRGLVGAAELALMKPGAWLVNTSRGPIVDDSALTTALREHRIAGAAVDVFDVEPLPADHPYRSLDNMLATPHVGYVSQNLYRAFYGDTVRNIVAWLDGIPFPTGGAS